MPLSHSSRRHSPTPGAIRRNRLSGAFRPTYAVLVNAPIQETGLAGEVGVAGIAALTVVLGASLVAAALIWLMTTQPESLAMLATTDNIWSFLVGLAARLLAII